MSEETLRFCGHGSPICRECESVEDSLRAALRECVDALIWCGGSPSFTPEGEAKIGYDKVARVAIAKAKEVLGDG